MSVPDHVALQGAVFQALRAHIPLLAALGGDLRNVGAFSHPDTVRPYVVIEGIASQPVATQEDIVHECNIVCAVYSDQPGGTQARDIIGHVAQALESALVFDGYSVVLQQGTAAQVQVTGDGRTYRGTYALRVVIEKNEE